MPEKRTCRRYEIETEGKDAFRYATMPVMCPWCFCTLWSLSAQLPPLRYTCSTCGCEFREKENAGDNDDA